MGEELRLFLSTYLFFLMSFEVALAHEGHSHASTPSISSGLSSVDLASAIESPMTFSFKSRLGHEDGQYSALMPGIYSYFGDDQMSTNLSYEYRFRNFSNQSTAGGVDYDNSHKFSTNLKKTISEKYKFLALAEAEQNKSNTPSRSVNNYDYYSISTTLTNLVSTESSASLSYQYSTRNFPNGTYAIPIPHQGLVGEPISPTDSTSAPDEIIKFGVSDAEHGFLLSGSSALGESTLSLEARYAINYSNFKSRQYNARALKVGVDSSLWKKATLLFSQSAESRNYSASKQELYTSELNLVQELGPKLSLLGLVRYNQINILAARNWMEGYAQLQLIF